MFGHSSDESEWSEDDVHRPHKRRRLEEPKFGPEQQIRSSIELNELHVSSDGSAPSLSYTPTSYCTPKSCEDEDVISGSDPWIVQFSPERHRRAEYSAAGPYSPVGDGQKFYRTGACEPGFETSHHEHSVESILQLPGQHEANHPSDDLTCFGMITGLQIRRDRKQQSSASSMRNQAYLQEEWILSLSKPHVIFGRIEERDKNILQTLASQSEIELQYQVIRKQASRFSRGGRKNLALQHDLELSVILYGNDSVYDLVGDFLTKCDIHLQDPVGSNRHVRYRNPQSLWAMDENAVRMTQDISFSIPQSFESFENSRDILTELEYEGHLPEAKQPSALKTALFSHQKQALTFMTRREQGWALRGPQEDLWRMDICPRNGHVYTNTITGEQQLEPPTDFRGGILGDTMGLGKSLTVLSLIANDQELLTHPSMNRSVKSTLIVVRAPLLHIWSQQLKIHLHTNRISWRFHHEKERINSVRELNEVDVVLTTYQTLVAEFRRNQSHPLFSTHWHRLVLDEAHDIRDPTRLTARTMRHLQANCRWAVTGTPIQNNLDDLASLYQFLRVEPYHNPRTFKQIVAHLYNQQRDDAMACIKRLIRCVMLRRSISSVTLPTKTDLVARLDFSQEEADFYRGVEDRTLCILDNAIGASDSSTSQLNVLAWINSLRMICNLGVRAKIPNATRQDLLWDQKAAQETYNGLVAAGRATCKFCHVDLSSAATEVADEITGESTQPRLSSCSYLLCGSCFQRLGAAVAACQHGTCHELLPVSTLSSSLAADYESTTNLKSIPTKVRALLQDLEEHLDHEKAVVFSFWTTTLDIVQECLESQGIGYLRFDGSVPNYKRGDLLRTFQEDPEIKVALMTISCGAVGLDLTAASRAYLMEPHWNPSVEHQALARIYRMGQTKQVTTIRYVMRNTFEDHVINVQKRKQQLTDLLLGSEDAAASERKVHRLQHLRSMIAM